MDLKINLDLESLKTIYLDYKPYLIPVVTILACILIFILIIIPQLNLLSDNRAKREEEINKLNILRKNLSIVSGVQDSELKNNLSLASKALPVNKDFEAILDAVSSAANISGVAVGDFEFSVGDITNPPKAQKKFPSLEIDLSLATNTDGMIRFIDEVYRTVPLVEASNVRVAGNSATVVLVFYYKPLPPLNLNPAIQFKDLDKNDVETLNKISSFNNALFSGSGAINPVSTEGAQIEPEAPSVTPENIENESTESGEVIL
ncbi:MAG: hypothetical protein HYV38_03585 [Candidatus Levybacteria bacterium]|nr:hypothetical protein [Candidatus Levybacteria bacterium]